MANMVGRPSLIERLFYTTVRLNGTDDEGDTVTGTAFFYTHPFAGEDHLFLVSNTHVVKELRKGTLTFHSSLGDLPDPIGKVDLRIREVQKGWYHHPDDLDLSIMPFSFLYDFLKRKRDRPYVQSITKALVPTARERREKIDALEDVHFIGYPNDIHDRVNNLPVVRKGTTATPYNRDFNGRPMFLLDGSIFPGSSGSPVLLIDQNGYINKRNMFVPKRRIFFLGILRSCFTFSEESNGKEDKGPLTIFKQMMDLGVVVRSDVLVEMTERYLIENAADQLLSGIKERFNNLLGPRKL